MKTLTETELRELAIEGILSNIAYNNIGIYPKSVQGSYEKRTDWMEGWNAAGMARIEIEGLLTAWVADLPETYKEIVQNLILTEQLSLHVNKEQKEVKPYILCNDLFYWACADAEDINLEEIPDLIKCLEMFPNHGDLLWVARKRQMRPQTPYYKLFTPEETIEFNKCGPERKRGEDS